MTTLNVQLPIAHTPNDRRDMLLRQLDRTIIELESEITALQRTLRERRQTLYAARHMRGVYRTKQRRQASDEVTPKELFGLSLEEAVLLVAERHAGVVESTSTNNLLRDVGLLPDDNRARTRLYHFLSTSPRFELVDRGVYRLVKNYQPNSGLTEEQEALLDRLRAN